MKLVFLLALVVSLLSCKKDPYPDGIYDGENGGLRAERAKPPVLRPAPRPVPPANAADNPGELKLSEGELFTYTFRIKVPSPTTPVAWINDLPDGATFDPKTLEFKWTPGFYDGNDPNNPTIKTRLYTIIINYKNSEDEPGEHKQMLVKLEVEDTPRKFEIGGSSSKSVYEGKTLEYEFKIDNLDYPAGPFKVTTQDMPANTRIEKVKGDDITYKLIFKPDFQHVKINDNDSPCFSWTKNCLKYEGKIVVFDPANHKTDKDVEIQVKDVRIPVSLIIPDNTQQGLDLSFSISSVDPNGEVAPRLSLVSDLPRKGDFKTSLKVDDLNKFSVLNVSWKDIPATLNGQVKIFEFKSCVLGTKIRDYTVCEKKEFKVTIVVKERKPPYFDRSEWKDGEIKYFGYNEQESFVIKVKDGDAEIDSEVFIDDIKISPEWMQKYVKYSSFYKSVRVKMDKPGIHQFSIIATSDYQVSSAQSFVFEVFQKDRADTLLFTDSVRGDEVHFYKETMGNVQLMNPAIQVLNTRNLSGRKNLIIGTDILKDINMKTNIEKAMGEIRNVIIASPLIENMPAKFLDELNNDYRVSFLGRYSQLPSTPDLSQMYFIYRKDFQKPKNKIKLKLNSTTESFDPLLFTIASDRDGCADVLDISNIDMTHGTSLYKLGIICERKNKTGRFAILGTEFSDLKTSEDDKKVPAKWLRKMINTNIDRPKDQI